MLLVDYQELCKHPEGTLFAVRDHCRLEADGFDPIAAAYAPRLSLPDYYAPEFGSEDLESIAEITDATRQRLRSATAFRPGTAPNHR